jgi:hypothetical protein
MTTPDKPKVSSWAVFLGRSPPMPPVPAGGWTRDTVNAAWRDRIASHPEGAPLSHADLAELLRMRDTFGNWFIPRVIRTENEPPAPEASFFLRIFIVPMISYYVVLIVAAFVFSFTPKTRDFYPLLLLSEDTLCAAGSPSYWRPFRCDAEVWATDLASHGISRCSHRDPPISAKRGHGYVNSWSTNKKSYRIWRRGPNFPDSACANFSCLV